MNHGPLLFLGVFFAMATSWFGLVLMPQLQIGRGQVVISEETGRAHPVQPPGLAAQGAEVYLANGCAHCHTRQVRQHGVEFDLFLGKSEVGPEEIAKALLAVEPAWTEAEAAKRAAAVPGILLEGVPYERAEAVFRKLNDAGAKAQVLLRPLGADIERGWGQRRTVALDYLFEQPVLLGSQRIGPDLANIGQRVADARWHYEHLHSPRSVVPGSTMPPYRYLFEKRKIQGAPSPDALRLTGADAPEPGYEIVPKDEARALVAYLLNQRIETPLYEAPMPPAAGDTDAAADDSNAPGQPGNATSQQ